MKGDKKSYKDFDINLLDCRSLGRGHNGEVFLLPDGKALKVCFNENSFYGEASILKKVNGSKYFPRIYEVNGNYMVREYVEGECLKNYIKRNGLSRELVIKILALFKEFKRLKFKKLDLRVKDIFIQPDGKLKVIDPKKFYTKKRNFPRHLSKGLYHLGVLDFFLEVVKEEKPKLYRKWEPLIREYISQNYEKDEDED